MAASSAGQNRDTRQVHHHTSIPSYRVSTTAVLVLANRVDRATTVASMNETLDFTSWFSLARVARELREIGSAVAAVPWQWEGAAATQARGAAEEINANSLQLSLEIEQLDAQLRRLWVQAHAELAVALVGAS